MKEALRSILRRPAFTLITVMVLGFGVGANSALFSVLNTVLLKPLPYPHPDRLVFILDGNPAKDQRDSLISPQRLADWNRLSKSLDVISGSYTENVTDTSMSEPERLAGRRVAPDYFRVFSTPPLIGRTFTGSEEKLGGPLAAVISEGLWTRRYGRRPDAIGQHLVLSGSDYSIVGVMPKAFAPATVETWLPA